MDSQRLVERLRQVEERFVRQNTRMRLDMRSQAQAMQAELQRTKDELHMAVEHLRQMLEKFQLTVTASLDRQGNHFARWLLDVETRLDEEGRLTQEGLQEMRAILEEHLVGSAVTLEDHEARLRRLEGQDRPPAA